MALPASGPISMSQVNAELGISPITTQISLNDAAVRTLFQKASGQIAMSDGYGKSNYANVSAYSTAGEWTFTVPSGVTSLWIKMWGAGGSAGAQGAGGAGGYMEGYLAVNSGNTVRLYVADVRGTDGDNACECYDNGFEDLPVRWPNNTGFGGQASFASSSFGNYMIVGGGGGGSEGAGGAGGGTTGGTGATGYDLGGNGGGQAAGGSGQQNGLYHATTGYMPGTGGDSRSGVACTYCGNGTACGAGGGGGGDGWGGGGLGYTSENGCDYPHGGGGGGGSSNYSGGSWSSVVNSQGSGTTPPETGNANYSSGVGVGGGAGFNMGGYGRVVIRY